ncbi:hypothetical protein VTH06DRAFT_800 [Thermothelomyces fergusii]
MYKAARQEKCSSRTTARTSRRNNPNPGHLPHGNVSKRTKPLFFFLPRHKQTRNADSPIPKQKDSHKEPRKIFLHKPSSPPPFLPPFSPSPYVSCLGRAERAGRNDLLDPHPTFFLFQTHSGESPPPRGGRGGGQK